MQILILANNDIGLYKFRKELINTLLKNGHDVYISLPDGEFVRPLIELGCVFMDTPINRRGINVFTDIKLFSKYKRMIKSLNPDIVVSYTIKPNIYGSVAARIAKKQYVVNITGLGTAFENKGLLRSLVILMYKFALTHVKHVIFENSSNRDEFVSYGCCPEEKTIVLNGAGVNTKEFDYIPYPTNETFRFLFIGRVMKEKGIEELLFSMKRLISEGHNCLLDVVGPCEENYKVLLKQCELEGWMKYYGFQSDVRPFISKCDCFVLPSYHEGMANTNLECASSGRPIITSNIPGCKEAVVENETGFLCRPKDALDLYDCMIKILRMNNKELQEMGKKGRNLMKTTFDRNNVVDMTLNALF